MSVGYLEIDVSPDSPLVSKRLRAEFNFRKLIKLKGLTKNMQLYKDTGGLNDIGQLGEALTDPEVLCHFCWILCEPEAGEKPEDGCDANYTREEWPQALEFRNFQQVLDAILELMNTGNSTTPEEPPKKKTPRGTTKKN